MHPCSFRYVQYVGFAASLVVCRFFYCRPSYSYHVLVLYAMHKLWVTPARCAATAKALLRTAVRERGACFETLYQKLDGLMKQQTKQPGLLDFTLRTESSNLNVLILAQNRISTKNVFEPSKMQARSKHYVIRLNLLNTKVLTYQEGLDALIQKKVVGEVAPLGSKPATQWAIVSAWLELAATLRYGSTNEVAITKMQ
eukprot:6197820-Pleurochrysis_carterae.AAC.1